MKKRFPSSASSFSLILFPFSRTYNLVQASIISKAAGTCTLRTKEAITIKGLRADSRSVKLDEKTHYITSLITAPGKKYDLLVK